MLDPVDFIGPLAQVDPSGPNLEYDPDFQALERAQQGKPEQSIGDSIKPAEEPDWRNVAERAEALLRRSRDLRVAVVLAQAQVKTDGIPGFVAGLAIIKGLLETQWDTVHPQLDADDDNDPTLRINTLLALAAHDGARRLLRETPLVHSLTLGRFSFRDVRIASGKQAAPPNMPAPPTQSQIDAAFRDAALESLQSTFSQLQEVIGNIADIDRILGEKVGDRAPDLGPMVAELAEIEKVMAQHLRSRGVEAHIEGEKLSGSGDSKDAAAPKLASSGEIATRDDVVRQLDLLCEYYARHEPSSPIPILLRRAKRLVKKDFMEIVRDLTPGGLAELEALAGSEKSDD